MPETVMIDLGEIRGNAQASVAVAPRRSRGVAAAASVALAAVLGGAAPVPAALVEARVPSVIGESMQVHDDRLYVFGPHPSQAGVGARTVTAYRLPDGRRLWRASVAGGGQNSFGMLRLGDALIVRPHSDGTVAPQITVLDADNGRQRWQRSGELMGSGSDAAGRRLVLLRSGWNEHRFGAFEQVVAVDAGTGRQAWTYRAASGASWAPSWSSHDGLNRMVSGLPSGRVEVRDIATGRLVAAENARSAAAARDEPWITIANDLVLVAHGDGRTVSAYSVDRLEHRWTGRWPNGLGMYVGPVCGALLCFVAPEGGLRGVDPRTGQVRWQDNWAYIEAVGSMLLASADSGGNSSPMRLKSVEPATGRAVRELGRWAVITGWEGDPALFLQGADGRTWFAELDPATGDVRLLGIAQGVAGGCRSARDSIVCRRRDAAIGIWRYR
jgi:outer membrane protein assembly factor BamB